MKATRPAPVLRAAVDPATWVAGLARTIGFALEALADPRDPHPAVLDGQLEYMLRTTCRECLDLGDDADHAAVAMRVACAYLTAGDLPEAYQALLTAQNALPRRTVVPSTTDDPIVVADDHSGHVEHVAEPERYVS